MKQVYRMNIYFEKSYQDSWKLLSPLFEAEAQSLLWVSGSGNELTFNIA